MARALRAWAIHRGGKNSVRNLRYGPRTRLVRGIYTMMAKPMKTLQMHYPMIQFLIILNIPPKAVCVHRLIKIISYEISFRSQHAEINGNR